MDVGKLRAWYSHRQGLGSLLDAPDAGKGGARGICLGTRFLTVGASSGCGVTTRRSMSSRGCRSWKRFANWRRQWRARRRSCAMNSGLPVA